MDFLSFQFWKVLSDLISSVSLILTFSQWKKIYDVRILAENEYGSSFPLG